MVISGWVGVGKTVVTVFWDAHALPNTMAKEQAVKAKITLSDRR